MNTCSECQADSFFVSQIALSDYVNSSVFFNFFRFQGYIQKYCYQFPTLIPNCVSYTAEEECLYCEEGFYLDEDNTCQSVQGGCPVNKMPNSNRTACIDFPLDGDAVSIPNCQKYSSQKYAYCILCDSAHVLSLTPNNCSTARTHLDADCVEYN